MVRTLEQILGELGSVYDPQVKSVRQQQALIPQQVADEEKGLQAKQTASYDEILGGARRRGLGYSGIPIAEQAKYNATEYMPALARLRTSARQQATSLEEMILGINERKNNTAQQLRRYDVADDQWNRDFAEKRRQYDEQMAEAKRQAAAQSAQMAGLFGGGGGQSGQSRPPAIMQRRQDGGYNFLDQSGTPISAATYASKVGMDVRDVLYGMGQSGDKYAQMVYNQIALDPNFGKNINRYVTSYSPLFWGVSVPNVAAPAARKPATGTYRPPVLSGGNPYGALNAITGR